MPRHALSISSHPSRRTVVVQCAPDAPRASLPGISQRAVMCPGFASNWLSGMRVRRDSITSVSQSSGARQFGHVATLHVRAGASSVPGMLAGGFPPPLDSNHFWRHLECARIVHLGHLS
mmetsp:Transcript_69448/g.190626  ORF Transcript_69448/g.190626 Transcript_69448/m.190626 type:complete len:119 (-) Transcript_69448:386-742(-)